MEFFKPGIYIDVMKYRRYFVLASVVAFLGTFVLLFFPGPNLGVDFRGGTELQLAFPRNIQAAELRSALEQLGYDNPDVVAVAGGTREYIIRVDSAEAVSAAQARQIKQRLPSHLEDIHVKEFAVAPGGDRLNLTLSQEIDYEVLRSALTAAGARIADVARVGRVDDHRYTARLEGVPDQLVRRLGEKLGNRGPQAPRRIEWVGPKAGRQLRDAAIKSLLYAIAFIMVYVAFRFDLRFAPGGIVALIHDAIITLGVLIVLQKEVNLTTIAALLTIVGFSINDTIVIYDRIRENMARMRDKSLYELINISTSQTLSRTIMTSATALMSVSAFFVFGTSLVRDFALTLFIGFLIGVYSSVYIAAPITEWMDKRFFSRGHAR